MLIVSFGKAREWAKQKWTVYNQAVRPLRDALKHGILSRNNAVE